MMLFLLAAFSLLQLPAGVGKADRQPPPPAVEVKADAILTVLTAPEKSRWKLVDRDGADLVASSDGKTAVFAAIAKGRYRIVVITGEVDVDIVVVVGDAPKPPPMPGPVDPVTPPDPLTAKLQAAYRLDTRASEVKAKDLEMLVEVYSQAATYAVDPMTMSFVELVARVKGAIEGLEMQKSLTKGGLGEVRDAIKAELKSAFPFAIDFDDANRAKAKVLFLKLSDALKAVK